MCVFTSISMLLSIILQHNGVILPVIVHTVYSFTTTDYSSLWCQCTNDKFQDSNLINLCLTCAAGSLGKHLIREKTLMQYSERILIVFAVKTLLYCFFVSFHLASKYLLFLEQSCLPNPDIVDASYLYLTFWWCCQVA